MGRLLRNLIARRKKQDVNGGKIAAKSAIKGCFKILKDYYISNQFKSLYMDNNIVI